MVVGADETTELWWPHKRQRLVTFSSINPIEQFLYDG